MLGVDLRPQGLDRRGVGYVNDHRLQAGSRGFERLSVGLFPHSRQNVKALAIEGNGAGAPDAGRASGHHYGAFGRWSS